MDLALGTDGDLDLAGNEVALVDGDDAIVQHSLIRMRFFRGEWFLDTRVGVPYFQSILIKNPDLVVLRSIFRTVILTTPGIASIDKFVMDFDALTRELSLTFTASKSDGTTISFDEEFIIS